MSAAAARTLDALGDPTRRRVFELIAGGQRSVAQVAAELPVSRPAVSQHLRVLKDAGLVTDRAEGRKRFYAVSTEGLEALRAWLDQFWDVALDRFKQAAEEAARIEEEKS